MNPETWAHELLGKLERHKAAVLAASAPVKQPDPAAPQRYKPGTRRVPHTPKGMGPRKTWSVS